MFSAHKATYDLLTIIIVVPVTYCQSEMVFLNSLFVSYVPLPLNGFKTNVKTIVNTTLGLVPTKVLMIF
jgi:hypothetical protein